MSSLSLGLRPQRGRPSAAPRPCGCAPGRPPSRGCVATGAGSVGRPRAAPPAAASGSRRSPAPACRGCRGRCGCAPRAPPGAALHAALLGQPAVVQRQRRLPRHGVEQRAAASAARSSGSRPRRERHPAELARRQHERRDEHRRRAGGGVELRAPPPAGAGRRRVYSTISVQPSAEAEQMRGHASRGSASDAQSGRSLRVERVRSMYGHPQVASPPVARRAATRRRRGSRSRRPGDLMKTRKKPDDVRLADEQIERELHGVALDRAPCTRRAGDRRSRSASHAASRARSASDGRRRDRGPASLGASPSLRCRHATSDAPASLSARTPRSGARSAGRAGASVRKSQIATGPRRVGLPLTPSGDAGARASARLSGTPGRAMLSSMDTRFSVVRFRAVRDHRRVVVLLVTRLARLGADSLPARARRAAAGRRRRRQVTVAAAVARDVTEWDEFTGRLEAVNTRRDPAARLRLRLSVSLRGRRAGRRASCCSRSTRPFQAEVDRLRAELAAGRAPRSSAPTPNCSAPSGSRPRTRCRRGARRRASFAAEVGRPGRRGRSRAARRRARTSSSPASIVANRRPRRPRHRHRRQLVSSGPARPRC